MTSTCNSATSLSILARLQTDDSAAWQEFLQLYRPLIAFWCRRQGASEQDINDLIQEVLISVARSIEQFRPSGDSGSFRAWLWTLTRNRLVDSQRRGPAERATGGSIAMWTHQQIPEHLDVDDAEEEEQFSCLVHRALEQVQAEFEPTSWQAFWRTTIDGLTTALAAEELGLTPVSVRQHRSRILRRLRRQLGELQ